MLRGEIWWVDLEPVRGREANKRRPAVIVSNDRANATAVRLKRGVITVVPVTTNVSKIYPFQVPLSSETSQPNPPHRWKQRGGRRTASSDGSCS